MPVHFAVACWMAWINSKAPSFACCTTTLLPSLPLLLPLLPLLPLLQSGSFAYLPTIASLSGNVGSLGGNLPLTLSLGGAALPAGPNAAASIAVTVAGRPCPLVGTPTASQVVCMPPASVQGMVFAEYWVIPAYWVAPPYTSGQTYFVNYFVSQNIGVLGPPGEEPPAAGCRAWACVARVAAVALAISRPREKVVVTSSSWRATKGWCRMAH